MHAAVEVMVILESALVVAFIQTWCVSSNRSHVQDLGSWLSLLHGLLQKQMSQLGQCHDIQIEDGQLAIQRQGRKFSMQSNSSIVNEKINLLSTHIYMLNACVSTI